MVDKILICIAVAFFILMPLVLICFDIDTNMDSDYHIRDPWTGEIIE